MNSRNNIYISRDISWLSFNERVLQEAQDPAVPLLERIRFLGIYSNNRDEFFRVRVAAIRRMSKIGKRARLTLGEDPDLLLNKIQKIVIGQADAFERIYQGLLAELETHHIHIVNESQLSEKQQVFVKNYFHETVYPTLFPIMMDNTPEFPYLKDKPVYLIVKLEKKDKKPKYALIEVPTAVIPRFLVLPEEEGEKYIILLDDVIRLSLSDIFSTLEFDKKEAYTIKMTRDAELDLDSDLSKGMVEKMTRSLKKRKKGMPVRLTYDSEIPKDLLEFLLKKMKVLKRENLIPGGRYHNFKDFIDFPNIGPASLRYKPHRPSLHKDLKPHESTFKAVNKKDILLAYPYQSFTHTINFLREASIDPKVVYIKIVLYRVAKYSNVVNALVNAIKNGKQVTAVVELQARFDEEANIYWAGTLQEEGAKVIYGSPGLKVHSKLLLIGRNEKGKVVNYAHVGTGNFNETTATQYTDLSLLTADERITREVEKVFDFYSDNLKTGSYKHLMVSPLFMRKKIMKLISREIRNARAGKDAWMILKLNSLSDREMIRHLYEASSVGVKIKIILRGICSLVPGIKGLSDNIEIISIVDRYLEHSRVYIFCNGGDEKYFLSSADMMTRNLDYRSEVAVPVYDKELQADIRKIADLHLSDNTKARIIDSKQDNAYRKTGSDVKLRSQKEIFKYFQEKSREPVSKESIVKLEA